MAYVPTDVENFENRRLTILQYKQTKLSVAKFLEHPAAFNDDKEAAHPQFSISFEGSAYGPYIVVTDEPMDVWAHISTGWIRNNISIVDIQQTSKSIGQEVASWNQFFSLDATTRSQLVYPSIVSLANKKRLTPRQMLGGRIMTWDEVAKQFHVVEERSKYMLFPKEQRKAFSFSQGFLVIGEHRQPGENLVWLGNLSRSLAEDIKQQSPPTLFKTDDAIGIEQAMSAFGFNRDQISGTRPTIGIKNMPMIFNETMKTAYRVTTNGYHQNTIEELTKMARNLKVKNYSGKTKSELIMLIGEHLAAQPPRVEKSMLLSGLSYTPEANTSFLSSPVITDLEDQYDFAIRVVGRAAYVPTTTASPAGRLNSNGHMQEYECYEPLDILTPEF